ncbi:hypothetical protein ACFQH3_12160 [Haladaptatus sp. GCM10025707]|uniref:hypothetical protein n=1 Tax=unclassified Haladaptatus TaxID=2622732 RepID=UPI0023E7BFC7|nr:hypothetical protein [Haladaptatus sp. QDMS2]
MTVDSPLTCYICGETSDRATVDLIGCFKDQDAASERFEEKHGREPESYLDVCSSCQDENPNHARNAREKYGAYE